MVALDWAVKVLVARSNTTYLTVTSTGASLHLGLAALRRHLPRSHIADPPDPRPASSQDAGVVAVGAQRIPSSGDPGHKATRPFRTGLVTCQNPGMPAARQDPSADMSRRDLLWAWLVLSLLLAPALAAVCVVGRWFQPGVGPTWIDGITQGVFGPPVGFALVALWRRFARRRHVDD
jgi:hypothetical protein